VNRVLFPWERALLKACRGGANEIYIWRNEQTYREGECGSARFISAAFASGGGRPRRWDGLSSGALPSKADGRVLAKKQALKARCSCGGARA